MTTTDQKSTSSVRRDLVENFKNKHYRDLFVAEQISSGLPLKIRKLREAKFPSQKTFAQGLGKHQSWVSQLENPNYGKLTLTTLLEVASTLDVALEVDFVPFSRIIERSSHLSPEWFTVPSFEEEVEALEKEPLAAPFNDSAKFYRPLKWAMTFTETTTMGTKDGVPPSKVVTISSQVQFGRNQLRGRSPEGINCPPSTGTEAAFAKVGGISNG